MIPWDDARLDAVEAEAKACESGDACTVDLLSLIAEVRRSRSVTSSPSDVLAAADALAEAVSELVEEMKRCGFDGRFLDGVLAAFREARGERGTGS